MAALDGIPFSVFCTSEDLRRLFTNSGYNKLPKTPNGIKNIVINYSKQEKKKLVTELKNLLALGKKFSLSFYVWTSSRNARYMNINNHIEVEFTDGSRFKNLGLVRMDGSMPSVTCIRLLKEKLSEFELSLDRDIVAIVRWRQRHVKCWKKPARLSSSQSQVRKMCDPLMLLLLLVEVKVTPNSRTTQIVLRTKPGGFEVIPVVSNPNELNNDYKSVIITIPWMPSATYVP
ncbi:unnamed protein product [Parnassius apollo]|uniref:(apollo) hypothetical protein n=1 Tax=Parnassius apollo TaxID=110799 RepID=A0A8S3YFS1_PARAO|nr:unnamed protein product [Parnassius apollo]